MRVRSTTASMSAMASGVRHQARNVLRLLGVAAFGAVSLSAQGNGPQQSLLQAIQRSDTPAVSRLLARGADPNVKDDEGTPALMLATLFADVECVRQL